MKNVDDRLEMLIGRFLDGEISSAEQKVLDDELQRNPEAGELLEQMRLLTECGRQAVASEVIGSGMAPDEVIGLCRKRQRKGAWPGLVWSDRRLRFALGLAAGFILGLLLHLALVWGGPEATGRNEQYPNRWVISQGGADDDAVDGLSRAPYQPVMRNVDWYGFTDAAGNEWLVQGVREGAIRPASYSEDLH